jgi:hypothetical protein
MDAPAGLTKIERGAFTEVARIAGIAGSDFWNAGNWTAGSRATRLRHVAVELVRGRVFGLHSQIDGLLASCLYLRLTQKRAASPAHKILYGHILEEMPLLRKRDAVAALQAIPKPILNRIGAINDLRNRLVHLTTSHYNAAPKSRNTAIRKEKLLYQGKDVFTAAGLEKFQDDAREVVLGLVAVLKPRETA